MSNKNTVEDLLAQLFREDITNPSSTYVINNLEEYVTTSAKSIQCLIENIPVDSNSITTNDTNSQNPIENQHEISDYEFEQLFRMKRNTFSDLQQEIENSENTDHISIKADTNLLLSLWVLGNTTSLHEVATLVGTHQDHVIAICEKYFEKIVDLSSKYVIWPTPTELLTIEKGFKTDYLFPGVVGVIGCLHIAVSITDSEINAAEYYNENTGNHTIVLQAVCDNNLLFTNIFVGFPGGNSIATILKASPLYNKLIDENSFLKKNQKHLLGGTEHPQLPTLLTPYAFPANRKPTARELKFNLLHSSVMYTMEQTFLIIENRFQRMKCLDCVSPRFATLTTGAICTLHNFTRLRNDHSCC